MKKTYNIPVITTTRVTIDFQKVYEVVKEQMLLEGWTEEELKDGDHICTEFYDHTEEYIIRASNGGIPEISRQNLEEYDDIMNKIDTDFYNWLMKQHLKSEEKYES